MAYHVRISDSALLDAEEYVHFIRQVKKEPEAAERWFRGLIDAVFSLAESPARCPLIPEGGEFPFELRELIYHSHRIIFRTQENTVTVLRVYHGSRRQISLEDIDA